MMCASTIHTVSMCMKPQKITQCTQKLITGDTALLIEITAACIAIKEIITLKLVTLTKKEHYLFHTKLKLVCVFK